MSLISRRAFTAGSVSAVVAVAHAPATAVAQTAQCVTGGGMPFMPNSLTVDCASRANFKLFRANPTYMGLTGVVSMTTVRGKWGVYPAGNLFLFPWLKKAGQALGAGKVWPSKMPRSLTVSMAKGPIPNWRLPLDEYFCRYCIEAPHASFIGVRIDEPVGINDSRRPWFTNVNPLADGKPVSVAWNSSNLNAPWFGGSRFIPKDNTCKGADWRKVIVAGLNTAASAPAC